MSKITKAQIKKLDMLIFKLEDLQQQVDPKISDKLWQAKTHLIAALREAEGR